MRTKILTINLVLTVILLESCCLSKIDCDPPYSDFNRIRTCCTDIKNILDLKMYLYQKNSDFKVVIDSASFDFNRMSGDSGLWTITFVVKKAYDVSNYDWLAKLDGKEYKITNIEYSQKQSKCSCTRFELKSFQRNGKKYNQNIVSIHD